MKKCDNCSHMKFYDAGPIRKLDDLSYHYCDKEHWEFDEDSDFGAPLDLETEEKVTDIWSDCSDYEENIITQVINDLIINSIKTGEPPEDLIPFKIIK